MSLKTRIEQDLKNAFKAGDSSVCDTLRLLKAEISNQEIALGLRETGLDETKIEQIITKEVKKRREAADLYTSAGRIELADKELAEAMILEQYLPEQLSEGQIIKLVDLVLEESKIDPVMANMGKIIGMVKARAGSSADGSTIAQIVKERLVK